MAKNHCKSLEKSSTSHPTKVPTLSWCDGLSQRLKTGQDVLHIMNSGVKINATVYQVEVLEKLELFYLATFNSASKLTLLPDLA